jgi:uncharacterized protein (UPF0261 family)
MYCWHSHLKAEQHMSKKTIAVIAALDTKGPEAELVANIIRQRGHDCLLIDVGVLGEPVARAAVTREEIVREAGANLDDLRKQANKAVAMDAMTRGAAVVATKLFARGAIHAIVGIGGSAGTAIATSAMRALPIGIPKIMVSTVAAGDTRPYVGTKDITMMYSVVDIAGINRISSRILANAAGAAIGMVDTEASSSGDRPIIAASMFGNTTPCVDRARANLTAKNYEVLVFHATGVGGATMESLINDRLVDGVLDVTTTEWADELCGGVFSAGPGRLDAAALAGIPQVVAPGCLDMVNFAAPETVPACYTSRNLYRWNANVTLMRTDVDENRRLGEIIAGKLNQATGRVRVLLPLRGLSQLDSVGREFWWPEADAALFRSLRTHLREEIPVIEIDANINDTDFADQATQHLLELIGMGSSSQPSARSIH